MPTKMSSRKQNIQSPKEKKRVRVDGISQTFWFTIYKPIKEHDFNPAYLASKDKKIKSENVRQVTWIVYWISLNISIAVQISFSSDTKIQY